MSKKFNVTGRCNPKYHYMVDLTDRLIQIQRMIERGDYFTINKARQYGKTTTLMALAEFLKEQYVIIYLDFQGFSSTNYSDEAGFAKSFALESYKALYRAEEIPETLKNKLKEIAEAKTSELDLRKLFSILGECCAGSRKGIVLMIDEVDAASNFQVFVDFLAQLRSGYLNRDFQPFFQSVILAGVYDVKNLKQKIRSDSDRQTNSPWNIAADFLVDMSFSVEDIGGMLTEYEADTHTGMDLHAMAQLIFDYTSGYPYLVSRICMLLDEQIAGTGQFPDRESAWTEPGIVQAVGRILGEQNSLFDSLSDKVETYLELRDMLFSILMNGNTISYSPLNSVINLARMFGFVQIVDNVVVIANRIFETALYNMFLTSAEMQKAPMYSVGSREKDQFIRGDHLNMELILDRFVHTFNDLYGDQPGTFKEEEGRRYFLLFVRPIINGKGNYYVEAQTRNQERTDVIIDYGGKQYIVELKIWRGESYHTRGENQLLNYLKYYHLDKGYMLSFCFNKNKGDPRVEELHLGDKILVEAIV